MDMPCLKEILADNHSCDDRPQRPSNFILRRTFYKVAVYEGHKMKGGITGDGLGGDLKPQQESRLLIAADEKWKKI